jgi:hypothetical protein
MFWRSGTFKPERRAELEAEGLVLLEERLRGRLTYSHFKAPGRRHHGKIRPLRLGIAITERRFVIVTGMLRRELANSEFDRPTLAAVEISLEGDQTVALRIDYDELNQPDVSGVITISFRTPSAPAVVEQLRSRIG